MDETAVYSGGVAAFGANPWLEQEQQRDLRYIRENALREALHAATGEGRLLTTTDEVFEFATRYINFVMTGDGTIRTSTKTKKA